MKKKNSGGESNLAWWVIEAWLLVAIAGISLLLVGTKLTIISGWLLLGLNALYLFTAYCTSCSTYPQSWRTFVTAPVSLFSVIIPQLWPREEE